MPNKCTNCKYCIQQDIGYSNYTVEGTDVDCLLGLNPVFPKDRWYGEDKSLEHAIRCDKFDNGYPVSIDVDHEDGELENYSDDEEIKELLRKY